MPIRRAQPSDIAALVAIEQAFSSDRLSARSFRRLIRRGHADVWVYTDQGVVLGDAVVLYRRGTRVARLYSLVVAAAARGRGLGGALMRWAERQAARRNCNELRLEVRLGNDAALALYRRQRYVDAGTVPAFYEDGAPAWRLRKRLDTPALPRRPHPRRGARLATARP